MNVYIYRAGQLKYQAMIRKGLQLIQKMVVNCMPVTGFATLRVHYFLQLRLTMALDVNHEVCDCLIWS